MSIQVGDRIQWIIGAEVGITPVGPDRRGVVYAVYPEGKKPYWVPFLMVEMDNEMKTLESLLNPPHRLAVLLSNPTLTGLVKKQ